MSDIPEDVRKLAQNYALRWGPVDVRNLADLFEQAIMADRRSRDTAAEGMAKALQQLLRHSGISDVPDRDKDWDDIVAERSARLALTAVSPLMGARALQGMAKTMWAEVEKGQETDNEGRMEWIVYAEGQGGTEAMRQFQLAASAFPEGTRLTARIRSALEPASPPVAGEPVAWQYRVHHDDPKVDVWWDWQNTSKRHFDILVAKAAANIQTRALYASPVEADVIERCAREWFDARTTTLAEPTADVRTSASFKTALNRLSNAEDALAAAIRALGGK